MLGSFRYYRLKLVLQRKDPPATYGRWSLRAFITLVCLMSVTTALGIYSNDWSK